MKSLIPYVIAAVAVMLGSAFVQGKWSRRWGEPVELELFAKRIKDVPMDIGDWQGDKLADMDERTMTAAGAVGALSRKYTHRVTKQEVRLDIVCGRMLDVFAHTPDRCYPSVGFDTDSAQVRTEIKLATGQTAEFWTAAFLKEDKRESLRVRVYWNFSSDGNWEAPESPKGHYAGQPALYKVYLQSSGREGEQSINQTASAEFGKVLFPELTKVFFPGSAAQKAQYSGVENPSPDSPTQLPDPDKSDK